MRHALQGWDCRYLSIVEIIHGKKANVYVATSPDLKGLVVESETLDELGKEARDLVPELLSSCFPKLLSIS